ncbi:hypothetical protein JCM10213_005697 [Rhodosporidiobolus nylandii]
MLWTPTWQLSRDAKETERRLALDMGRKLLDEYAGPCGLTPERELEILSSSAAQIVQGITQRRPGYTAQSVMLTFIRSSMKAHERTNCLTEIMYAHALKEAQDLDAEFEKTGVARGPLHGLPVSLKDQINVANTDSTIGFTHLINRPCPADATLVTVLRTAGAIPFVKTNVPQTMLSFECGNPLFGTSRNPHDPRRTPGGSSGGEAALLASDGSPLGIGSDVGGSLRIPSHFSGCFSLKPCHGRISSAGCATSNPGSSVISSSMGGMGRCVEDVELVHKVLIDAAPRLVEDGEALVPTPWREVQLPKKLRFGYFLNDGFCRASPACQRAVLETVDALRKKSHECVEFVPPNPLEAMELFVALTSAGRYETLLSGLLGDPQESSLWLVTVGPRLPSLLRRTIAWVAENVIGDEKLARLLRVSCGKSVTDLQEWQHKRDLYVAAARKELWQTQSFDAVLCAPQATPALKHGQTWNLSPLAIGTILWNVIDSSVGLVPVTSVDRARDALTPSFLSSLKEEPGSKLVEDRVYAGGVYDAEEMHGLPVGVQIVGKHWDEEKVVKLMGAVDDALGKRGFGLGDLAKRREKEERVY